MAARRPDTRSEVLQAALELFSAQGFAGTSLREVADRLGLTKAALYYHFTSKEQLVAELLEPLFTDVDALLEAGGGGRRLLEDYVDLVLRHRRLVGLAFADLSVLGQAGLGLRAHAQGARLAGLLLDGPPDLAGQVRVALAIGGMQVAVSALADQDPDVVRDAVLEAAAAALALQAPVG